MASEPKPNPLTSFFMPSAWEDADAPITQQNIGDFAVTYPIAQNGNITFPNNVFLSKEIPTSDDSTKAVTSAWVKDQGFLTAGDDIRTNAIKNTSGATTWLAYNDEFNYITASPFINVNTGSLTTNSVLGITGDNILQFSTAGGIANVQIGRPSTVELPMTISLKAPTIVETLIAPTIGTSVELFTDIKTGNLAIGTGMTSGNITIGRGSASGKVYIPAPTVASRLEATSASNSPTLYNNVTTGNITMGTAMTTGNITIGRGGASGKVYIPAKAVMSRLEAPLLTSFVELFDNVTLGSISMGIGITEGTISIGTGITAEGNITIGNSSKAVSIPDVASTNINTQTFQANSVKTNEFIGTDNETYLTYVPANNVLSVQKNISGANISGAVITGITSMNTPLLTVSNTGTIVTLKTDTITGSDNGAIMSYDTATETATMDSLVVKIPNTLKTNTIEKNTDSKLDIGVGAGAIIRIGTTTSQTSNLDTITIGSLTSSIEMVGTVFTEKIKALSPSSAVDLFPNVTTGSFSIGSGMTTGSVTIGNESVSVSISDVASSNINTQTFQANSVKTNEFIGTDEEPYLTYDPNLETTTMGTVLITGTSSTAPTQSVGDSSTKIATTAFVQGELTSFKGTANTFTAKQTATELSTNTISNSSLVDPVNLFTTGTGVMTFGAAARNLTIKPGSVYVDGNIYISGAFSTAPTQGVSNNSTRIATTAFVKSAIADNETTFLTESNTFSGIVNFSNDSTCKTQTTVSNSTRIASTAFVKAAIAANQTTFLASSPTFSATVTTDIIKTNSIRSPSSVTDLNLGTVDTQNINLGKTGQYLTINSQQTKLGTGALIDGCLSINATESAFRNCIRMKSNYDGAMYFIQFTGSNNVDFGAIGNYGSGITFSNFSDRRLKEDIIPMENTLDKIMALKPSTYKWKSTGQDDEGFIAQEVFEVFPQMRHPIPKAVDSQCDCPVDDKGNPVYHGLDYGKFTPQIIKAIQEMKHDYETKIASLEERLAKLELK